MVSNRGRSTQISIPHQPGSSGNSSVRNVCTAVTTQRPCHWTVTLECGGFVVTGRELTGRDLQEAQVQRRMSWSTSTGCFLPLFWFSFSEKKRELEGMDEGALVIHQAFNPVCNVPAGCCIYYLPRVHLSFDHMAPSPIKGLR